MRPIGHCARPTARGYAWVRKSIALLQPLPCPFRLHIAFRVVCCQCCAVLFAALRCSAQLPPVLDTLSQAWEAVQDVMDGGDWEANMIHR